MNAIIAAAAVWVSAIVFIIARQLDNIIELLKQIRDKQQP